jgi:hypothetical protein
MTEQIFAVVCVIIGVWIGLRNTKGKEGYY